MKTFALISEAENIPYPSTEAGVIKFMQNPKEVSQSLTKSLDLPNCDISPDGYLDGVWAIDSLKIGARVIVYLAGFEDESGEVRKYSDFEQGQFTIPAIRKWLRSGKVTLKDLATWEKKGNLDAADLAKFQEEFS